MSPEFKKTPLMDQLENTRQQPIDQLLRDICRGRSFEKAAGMLGIGSKTLTRWLKQLNIEKRPRVESNRIGGQTLTERYTDPEFKSRHREAAKRSWDINPDEKAQRITKAQPPEVRGIKSQKQTEHWQKHPEEKERFLEAGHQSRKADRAERMKESLGEDPKQRLKEMIQQGLSGPEIAKRTGKKPTTVTSWMQIEDLHPRKTISLDRATIEYRRTLVQRAIQENLGQYLQPEDWQIITMRYVSTGPIPSLKKIASELKISKETARQRELRAFAALKNLLTDNPESID